MKAWSAPIAVQVKTQAAGAADPPESDGDDRPASTADTHRSDVRLDSDDRHRFGMGHRRVRSRLDPLPSAGKNVVVLATIAVAACSTVMTPIPTVPAAQSAPATQTALSTPAASPAPAPIPTPTADAVTATQAATPGPAATATGEQSLRAAGVAGVADGLSDLDAMTLSCPKAGLNAAAREAAKVPSQGHYQFAYFKIISDSHHAMYEVHFKSNYYGEADLKYCVSIYCQPGWDSKRAKTSVTRIGNDPRPTKANAAGAAHPADCGGKQMRAQGSESMRGMKK